MNQIWQGLIDPISMTIIGLELAEENGSWKGLLATAEASFRQTSQLIQLDTHELTPEWVAELHHSKKFISIALPSSAILIRPLTVPLTQRKEIEEALPFQLEPILPYPIEEAIVTFSAKPKGDSTDLMLFAVRKERLHEKKELYQSFTITPDRISSVPDALIRFTEKFLPEFRQGLVFHFGDKELTGMYLNEEGEWSSAWFAIPKIEPDPSEENWKNSPEYIQIERTALKIAYSLSKQTELGKLSGILCVGPGYFPGLDLALTSSLGCETIQVQAKDTFAPDMLQKYAVPIGLALVSPDSKEWEINFQKNEEAHSRIWHHFQGPVILYTVLLLLFSVMLWLCTLLLQNRADKEVQDNYLALLNEMNQSPEQFEEAFHKAHSESPSIPWDALSLNDVRERVFFLQQQLSSSPVDAFPLLPHIPRVSDVLAWLNTHPAFTQIDENGNQEQRLKLESFQYTMVKRPEQKKKQEKYQVKIDLEFSTDKAQWAREFHDALIAPNRWVDPKGEIKWGSNRGKYKTSFFLKDLTIYSGGGA